MLEVTMRILIPEYVVVEVDEQTGYGGRDVAR